jgi:phospholipase C
MMFGSYGVRVPAIIISPWIVPQSVTNTVFDHTSIIKTILLRFCPQALDHPRTSTRSPRRRNAGHPQYLGERVAQANHLGELLSRTTPRPPQPATVCSTTQPHGPGQRPQQEAPQTSNRSLGELQERILAAAAELTRLGHPADRP